MYPSCRSTTHGFMPVTRRTVVGSFEGLVKSTRLTHSIIMVPKCAFMLMPNLPLVGCQH